MQVSCKNAEYRAEYARSRSHFTAFVQIAMRWHAHERTRLSGYVAEYTRLMPTSLLVEDADLHLHEITVDPSPQCNYFAGDTALVPTFTKRRRIVLR